MIRAGEAGGVLDLILVKLKEFLESARDLRESIMSAMIYPIILLGTGGVSIAVLLTFVLPKFSVIFADLGRSLPVTTQMLLGFSSMLRSYWWAVIAAIALSWAAVSSYIRSDGGSYQWDALKLSVLGGIIRKLETARFCRTLGTLLGGGVPLIEAIKNAKEVLGNRVIASAIAEASQGVREGKGIGMTLASTNVLPTLAISMIKVGEETGQMEAMLLQIATLYENGLREAVKRFVSLLEPALIVGMGLVVGFIVISMLSAIFSITDLPV
jgi:general secretion pathway protein F